jgi:hypothetical protein
MFVPVEVFLLEKNKFASVKGNVGRRIRKIMDAKENVEPAKNQVHPKMSTFASHGAGF